MGFYFLPFHLYVYNQWGHILQNRSVWQADREPSRLCYWYWSIDPVHHLYSTDHWCLILNSQVLHYYSSYFDSNSGYSLSVSVALTKHY